MFNLWHASVSVQVLDKLNFSKNGALSDKIWCKRKKIDPMNFLEFLTIRIIQESVGKLCSPSSSLCVCVAPDSEMAFASSVIFVSFSEIVPPLMPRFNFVPSLEYETLRRKLYIDFQDFWWFISSQVKKVIKEKKKKVPELNDDFNNLLSLGLEYKR